MVRSVMPYPSETDRPVTAVSEHLEYLHVQLSLAALVVLLTQRTTFIPHLQNKQIDSFVSTLIHILI